MNQVHVPFMVKLQIAVIGGFFFWIIFPFVLVSILFRGSKTPVFGDDNSVDNSTTITNNYNFAGAPTELGELANEIAEEYGLPPEMFLALLRHESAWNPRATSPKGARGLGQVMPSTAREKCGIANPDDLYDPETNLHCSAKILREELRFWSKRYDDVEDIIIHTLGSYNAGRDAVLNRDAVNSFGETRRYVARIMKTMGGE